ncbi:SMP-30/gluconolactonase/LRE family protein [Ramlibacter tataouinensis]|uniref:SMP-30/gluconolactonase/LRE family protein n=1 Tax=Ramlibacter tataouinensis TaxID=94132 RepID=UPI0022F38BD6|nr:SMP-30/gluconolactonase/LRE family protein [Ramlibacter tataouinensis]WBX99957.1 SMP-30/gluconolactonase/LRE family protein [Ramlibacter tataouinensis]
MTPWQSVAPQRDQLGESPFWHPGEQRLYWIDIPGRAMRRTQPGSGRVESWPMPQEPGCLAPALSGGWVMALRDGVYRAREWGGVLSLLQRFDHDPATTRFNDGKADPLGRFWAGTVFEPKTAPAGELFSLDGRPDNGAGGAPVVERKAGGLVTANGLAWSPAGDTVYWADTQEHRIRAWDWDARRNVMSRERVFHQFDPKPAGWQPGQPGYGGRPDGAAVDAEGGYWCAMFEGGRIVRLSPAGDLVGEIATPMLCPTMPCFGGADLRILFVTSAGNRSAAEMAARPLSGHVVCTRVETPGLPVNFFID